MVQLQIFSSRIARLFLISTALAFIVAGCSESENAPAAPETPAAAKIGPEADYDGGNLDRKVVFVQSYEDFDALTGDVESRDFSYLPVPASSCCDDCEAEGLEEIEAYLRTLPWVLLHSPACLRTENRGVTVLIADPPTQIYGTMIRGFLFEYSGVLEGQAHLSDGSTADFHVRSGIDEIARFGIVSEIDIDSLTLSKPAVLYSLSNDPRIAEREDSVIVNIKLIRRTFEDFAEVTGGMYPVLGSSTTPEGYTVEDLLPGGHFPINPFSGTYTDFFWGGGAHADAGEIAATIAITYRYTIEGRGSDPAAPYIYTALPPPPAKRMERSLRIVRSALEAFATENGGQYPTYSGDETTAGDTLNQFFLNHAPPISPYSTHGNQHKSSISWNADADTISGAIAILIARPDFYMLRARGDDPHGYIDTYLIPEGRRSWAERE